MGANPGFLTEETTVVLPTAPLGGKVVGRRSGRPDGMTGHDKRKKLLILCCERSTSHAGTCWKTESMRVSINKINFHLFCIPAET